MWPESARVKLLLALGALEEEMRYVAGDALLRTKKKQGKGMACVKSKLRIIKSQHLVENGSK